MLYPLLFLLLAGSAVALMLPPSYDVVWTEAGVNQSADSMPVGGGDIGLNVWYENGKRGEPLCELQGPANSLPL